MYNFGKPDIAPVTGSNLDFYSTGSPEDCNDYFGNKNDNSLSTAWIDNDCNGKANCEDPVCTGDIGPSEGRCCAQPSDCTPYLPDAACKAPGWECDCEPLVMYSSCIIDTAGSPNFGNIKSGCPAIVKTGSFDTCISGVATGAGHGDKFFVVQKNGNYKIKFNIADYLSGTADCQEGTFMNIYDSSGKKLQNMELKNGIELARNSNTYLGIYRNLKNDCKISIKII